MSIFRLSPIPFVLSTIAALTMCPLIGGEVEANHRRPAQAPRPLQAPVGEYWVIGAPAGSCGCAPNTSCVCGPSCPCYGIKPAPKPKPPIAVRRRITIRACQPCQPVTYPMVAPTFAPTAPFPTMGGSFPIMGGGMGGGFRGGFGGGCGGGGCGGGG